MIDLAVRALATWRLTHLLMFEVGPWRAITRLRASVGVRHDAEGFPEAWPDDNVFECFLCLSIWIGLACAVLPSWALRLFALSGIAIGAERWYHGKG